MTQGDTRRHRGRKWTQKETGDTRDKGGQKGHEGIQGTQGDTRDIEDRGNTRDTGGHKEKPGTGKKPKRCHKKAMKPIKVFMQHKKTGEIMYLCISGGTRDTRNTGGQKGNTGLNDTQREIGEQGDK